MHSHTETREFAPFALAMTGLGVLALIYGDFALQWQPVPPWLPLRVEVAYLSGLLLLVAGIGLFFGRIAARCALALTLVLLVCWVLPQLIKVAAVGVSIGSVLGLCETLAVMTGGWLLWASMSGRGGLGGLKVARSLFALCCVVFGLSHFVYADFTAGMIPHWLPLHLWLAYATGAGHLGAGLAILVGIRARLAAVLEALMMSSFVILVHIPSLIATPSPDWAPDVRIQLTALLWASALAGSAWIVAGSLRVALERAAPTMREPLAG
jgi:uncharacterized membrane protein